MGFQTEQTKAPGTATGNDSWKAQGFLNFYLPTQDGGRRKVGAIALKGNKPAEKTLLEWLNADPQTNAQQLIDAMSMEFQSATPSEGSNFALPIAG